MNMDRGGGHKHSDHSNKLKVKGLKYILLNKHWVKNEVSRKIKIYCELYKNKQFNINSI
jgi:hypothetical protein